MGSKKINKYLLLSGGVMTGTNTINSAIQNVQNFDNVGLQIAWTGTAVGTISVQCSIDFDQHQQNLATWIDLTFSPVLNQPAGAAGNYLVDLNNLPFPYVRVHYVNTSGVGALTVWIFSKDLN